MDADGVFLRFVPLRFCSAEIMDHFSPIYSASTFMCREKFAIVSPTCEANSYICRTTSGSSILVHQTLDERDDIVPILRVPILIKKFIRGNVLTRTKEELDGHP
jgi:hypothetical protein